MFMGTACQINTKMWSYSYKRDCPQHTEKEKLNNSTMAQKKESRFNWTSVKTNVTAVIISTLIHFQCYSLHCVNT